MHVNISEIILFRRYTIQVIKYANCLGVLFVLLCQHALATEPGSLKWSFDISNGVYSHPAIAIDGTIYVSGGDGVLYAFNTDGSIKWQTTIGKPGGILLSSPALDSNGKIYVGAQDRNLYALNPDGSVDWTYKLSTTIFSSPAIGADGTIYIADSGSNLTAVSSAGELQWRRAIGTTYISAPAIGSDGTIYLSSDQGFFGNNEFLALNPDGSLKWRKTADFDFGYTATDRQNNSYVALGPIVFGFNGTGRMLFNTRVDADIDSIQVDAEGNLILVGSRFSGSLDAEGNIRWQKREEVSSEDFSINGAAIKADGTIIVGRSAYNADGSMKWSLDNSIEPLRAPTIGQDGTIYSGNSEGIVAVYANASPLADSPWPTVRGNRSNTGNVEALFKDEDSDGVFDHLDNCASIANPDQQNADNDALGDACDNDDDNDGILDDYELAKGLDPFDATDANLDLDADGLTNLQEFNLGTNPSKADTDGDGVNDANEVEAGTDPLTSECLGYMCGSQHRGWKLKVLQS